MKNFNSFFNQLTAMPKRLAMVLTVLFTMGVGSMWGAVESGTIYNTLAVSSLPEGWSGSDGSGTSYIKLIGSDHYIQTDAFCVKSFSTIKIKARKYGGPTNDQAQITVEWIVGDNATSLGTITPSSTTLTDYTISSPAAVTADKEGCIKISCKGASSSKGSGVSQVTITYSLGSCSGGGNTGGGSGDSGDDSGDDSECVWTLVTDVSDLKISNEVVIAAKDYNYALSTTQNNNNRGHAAITKNGNNITFGNDVQILVLQNGTTSGTFAFYTGSGYLYAASSGSNYLRTQSTNNANGSWKITISGNTATIVAQGSNTRNTMQYNSSSSIFACYGSASQKALVIYKKVCTSSTPTTYTVTFDANGHGTAPDEQTVTSGEKATEPDDPEETGYIFEGWFEYQSCTGNSFDFATTPITGDITLYAKWTAIQKTITLNANGGSGHTASVTATYDSNILDPSSITNPTQTGYTFDGWYSGEGGTGSLVINTSGQLQANVSGYTGDNGVWKATQNKTLYAKWTPITYKITYNAGSGTCTTSSVTGTYSTGVTLPTSSPSSKCASEGWTFAGWAATTVSATSTAPTLYQADDTYKPTSDIELHAVYVKNTFILSLEHNSTTYYVGAYESSTSILKAETNRNNAVEFQIDDNYLRCESGYISHNSTSSTNISCYASKDKVFPWTITENAGEIIFQSTKAEGNDRYLGFNYNNGNPRFAAYVNTYAHSLTKTSIFTYDSNPDCCSTIAPTNGAYNTDSDTEVILTWEDANNYGRYHITGGNLAAEGVYSENKNYPVSGLTKCQSYTFQVTAYPTDGCESPAITIEATPYKVKTVTFIDESSTTTQNTSCEAESVTVPTASKDCYTSVWKDQDGKEYNSGATITPTKDLTLTAHYNIITYTIQFVDEVRTTILQSSTVDCGTTPAYTDQTPTKESDEIYEYEFAGWSPTIVAAKADATYTATYNKTKRTYKVQWFVNGVQYGTDQTVTAGETVTAPAIAEVPCGAVVAGWTDAEGGNYVHASTLHLGATPSIEIRSNKIFYAVFADYEN